MELTLHFGDVLLCALAHQIAPLIAAELGEKKHPSPWMDVAGVAAYAVMTEQAVRDAVKHGHLNVHRTSNGRLRFRIEDVESFLRGEAG